MNTPSSADQSNLMSITNSRVDANARVGSNSYAGWLAAIRAGITPAGEVTAFAQAAPHLAAMNSRRQQSAALRAAAIRAINKDVRHELYQNLGTAFAKLNVRTPSASIEDQVSVLPLMNVDAAALVLDGLIGRLAGPGIGIDFLDLEKTLLFWGSGLGTNSRRVRIILDFYSLPTTKKNLPLGNK